MAEMDVGLRGFIGELVVQYWLEKKYNKGFTIVRQIMPEEVDKKGGGYLDFGVINNKQEVVGVYEVKTQDYILDKGFKINKSLRYIWDNQGRILKFITQDKREFIGCKDTTGRLILLVGANDEGIKNIGCDNLKNVILFDDILNDNGFEIDIERLKKDLIEQINVVLNVLKNPVNGKTTTKKFQEKRGNVEL
ncbi:MAG: hypothetical protein KA120_03055 [Candidatus Goldbacteria bacterium]|nr:hypothetical protein [Candidatus Goldiibacteriota bacterium]